MTFKEFVDLVAEADKTKQIYKSLIKRWTTFAGFDDPDKFTDAIRNHKLDPYQFLQSVIANQKAEKRASITILQAYYTMKRFIEWESEERLNGVKLEKLTQTLPGRRVKSTDSAPNDTEVLKLIHHSNLRGRVALILALTSGMRVGELAAMKLEWIDFNSDPIRITIPATLTKTKRPRTVFTTQECAQLIKQLIGDRKTGSLFPSLDPTKTYDENTPASPSALANAFSRNLKKCGLRDKITEDSPMFRLHSHSFRKWFYSKAIASGMPGNYAEILLGHTIGLDAHYLRVDQEKLASEYKKIEPSLVFLNRENGEVRKTVQTQSEQIGLLQGELATLKQQNQQLASNVGSMVSQFMGVLTKLGVNTELEIPPVSGVKLQLDDGTEIDMGKAKEPISFRVVKGKAIKKQKK
ncbi:site-specific integrase [Candidatus Bathyarchaeota archaeon]|nr:site-specific integrase [Candidatus Bathyarchaeota archaeon]